MGTDDLQADGHPAGVPAAGQGDGRHAGEVDGHGVDIRQVHLQGIADLLADAEGGGGRGGRHQEIDLFEGLVEIALDERPHALGLVVVGVIIAGAEHVGAEHDAAFYFVAEALAPDRGVHGVQAVFRRDRLGAGRPSIYCSALPGPESVLHPVVPRQVGRCLGRYQDVVRGHGVLGVGQVDALHAGAERFHAFDRAADALFHGGVQSFGHVLIGHADAQAFDALLESGRVVRNRLR